MGDCLLTKVASIVRAEHWVAGDHAEVIRESGSGAWRVTEQVVDDRASIETGKGAVLPPDCECMRN